MDCHHSEVICEGAKNIEHTEEYCEECGAMILKIKYEDKTVSSCIFCNSLTNRERPQTGRGRRGRGYKGHRGGKRGRGRRGRGRNQIEDRLTFDGF